MTLHVAAQHRFRAFSLDIAFTAADGVTVLFGPSGSGKSTVLSVVNGLLTPDAGRVEMDGTVLLDTAARLSVPPERRRCGMVFQDAKLLPHLSVDANLRYGLRRAPPGATGPSVTDVVDLLGLAPLLRRRIGALSGGEAQRAAIGRALLSRPRLLLMDEPLASLDGPRKAEILPYLEKLRDIAKLPILYVTHALDEVDRLADTLVLLEAGRVLTSGALEVVMARPDLRPLATLRDAGAVLTCHVDRNDAATGLTTLRFDGGTLAVPLRPESPGTRLRLRVRARDVALAIEEPRGISSHNILAATIIGLDRAGPHEVIVSLLIGPTVLLARLTRDSVGRLALETGQAVFALVKSTTFDR